MADNNVSNYVEQGGARTVIRGSLDVASGGDLDIESGAALKLGGTQVTASAAQLNRTAVTTAGIVEASKVVVAGASQDIDQLDVTTTFKLGGTQVTVGAAAINKLVQGAAGNKAITGGEVAFTATTAFDTGLSTLDVVLVSMVSNPSVTDGYWATAAKGTTVGWVDLYSWKPTAANNLEPVAGSASVTVGWLALGEAS